MQKFLSIIGLLTVLGHEQSVFTLVSGIAYLRPIVHNLRHISLSPPMRAV